MGAIWSVVILSSFFVVGQCARATELSETDCLARNIYFESRGESTLAMVAVGFVTLNRVENPSYPSDICSVVYDNWQFSWTQDNVPNVPFNMTAFRESWLIASALLSKEHGIIDPTHGSTHYHSEKIVPTWSRELNFVKQIGAHKFYQ